MESVATPIESKVNGVDKLLYMQSYNANDGKLTLNVYFDVGTDVDIMQVNTQNRVGQAEAQLPDAVKREGVVVNRSSPDILMVIGSQFAQGHLRRGLPGQLLRHQPGGRHQAREGRGRREELHRPGLLHARLAAARQARRRWASRPQDISNAIKEQNAQSPAGRIGAEPAPPGQEMQFNVRALGLLKDPKEFEEIIIRSNPDGSQVKIKDVGRVELGAQTYDLRARLNQIAGRRHRHLPRARRQRHRDGGQREEDPRGGQDAVSAGHGIRHHARFHPADQGLDGGDRAYAVRGGGAGAHRGLHLSAKLPRHASFRCARCRFRCWARSSCSRCWASA